MIRQVVEDHTLSEVLWLVKNGLSFDLACSLSPEERAAFCIRFGMFEGGEFDWSTGDWKETEQ